MTPEQETQLLDSVALLQKSIEERFEEQNHQIEQQGQALEKIQVRFEERDKALEESKQLSLRLQNYALSLITAAVVSVIVTAITVIVRG